jgi:zinc protease
MRLKLAAAAGFLSLAIGAAGGAVAQQTGERSPLLPVDPSVTVGTLQNGLRYYIRANKRPENRAELRLVVNAGSVLEDDDQRGLAHFVEHMAFNGTLRYPKQALIDYLERIGMRFGPDINAYTGFDETVYSLQVPTDSVGVLETAFEILEDWAHQLVFDAEMIDSERGVVIEEWRLGRGAAARMFDKQFPILFKNSAYAERLPIGSVEVLESFEHEALMRYYQDWYRPDLMAVVAVGDFDSGMIEGLVRRHFEQMPSLPQPRSRSLFPVPDHDETLVAVATDKEATESRVSIYYKQPLRAEGTIESYRQLMVERLYNSMLNDRLFELTQRPTPPFLYASSGQGKLIRSKEVYVLGAGVEDGRVEPGLAALLTEGERVARYGFTSTELERHKREVLRWMEHAHLEREKTNSAVYAFEYVQAFLGNDPIPGIELEYLLHQEMVPDIQVEEVNRLAREWLTDRNRVILVNSPDKEGLPVPSEQDLLAVFEAVRGSDIGPYVDSVDDAPLVAEGPAPGTIVEERVFDAVGVTLWRLSNGARVILKPTDFKEDEILFRASSPGGTSLAPDADYVAASTAAEVVSASGLDRFSVVDLQKKLSGKAVSLSPDIGPLYEGLSGSASPEDLATLFELIYLTFRAPRRDTTAYLAFRTQVDAVLANRDASPTAAFGDTLKVTLAQHHFRERPATIEVYQEMDLDKSFEFYQDRFADASDFTFVFTGSFQVEMMRPLVTQYLAALPSTGREETWRDVGIRPPEGVVQKAVYRGLEPRSQTYVLFTGPFEYTRTNRHLIRSLSEVLQIRLREKLREDLAGTYGVSVGATTERDPVPAFAVSVSFAADPDRLDDLVKQVFAEIDSLKVFGPNQEYIQKVQEAQRRSRETSLKQNNYWLYQLLYADRFGTHPSEILTYESLIEALTADMIAHAASRYLPRNNYIRVSLYPQTHAP